MTEVSPPRFISSKHSQRTPGAAAISQRQHCRYLPLDMQARLHTSETATGGLPELLPEAMVVDFSPQGAAVLVKHKSALPAVGAALQLQLDYQGRVTRKIPVTVVHRRTFGAFAHLGVRFAADQQDHEEFEAMEISCIERALFL